MANYPMPQFLPGAQNGVRLTLPKGLLPSMQAERRPGSGPKPPPLHKPTPLPAPAPGQNPGPKPKPQPGPKPNPGPKPKPQPGQKPGAGFFPGPKPVRPRYHWVQRGETLHSIARRYHTTPSQLMQLNRIRNPYNLRPGQIIRVA